MIYAFNTEQVVGTIVRDAIELTNKKCEVIPLQPLYIIREATRGEYLAANPENPSPHYLFPYYYEVSTD